MKSFFLKILGVTLFVNITFLSAAQKSGCFLRNGSLSEVSGIVETLTNSELHRAVQREVQFLRERFQLNPSFFYFDDGAGTENAFATAVQEDDAYEDGTVCLGKYLLVKGINQTIRGTNIPIILAHEFAHILDFKYDVIGASGKKAELFADYCAGAFMFIRHVSFDRVDINGCLRTFRDLGDTDFGSSDHHGTPQERFNALKSGFENAEAIIRIGQYLSVRRLIDEAKLYLENID